MILIAPDKYKGTLTAPEACDIIAKALIEAGVSGELLVKAPMADGGEGTAATICSTGRLPGLDAGDCCWDICDGYCVERRSRTAVIDSSSVIGLQLVAPDRRDILRATSMPLGVKVREILKGGCRKVIIGVGGTATCDGGEGFLDGLGREQLSTYRDRLLGLCDVQVPLVAPEGCPSALMFAPQKGAGPLEMEILRNRLEDLRRSRGSRHTPYDGAGGGLGSAIGAVIGAECRSGAEYVLDCYDIPWDRLSLAITGEGRIDAQTAQGKVVQTVASRAERHGIPVVAFGGVVAKEGVLPAPHSVDAPRLISTADYHPTLPLDRETAALRLRAAVIDYCASSGLGSSGCVYQRE